MGKQFRMALISIATLAVLLMSALHPLPAMADDSTPVAPSSPAAVDTSAPATQAPPAVDTSAPATTVASTDTTVAATDTTMAPTDTPAPAATVEPTDTTTPPVDTTVAPTDTSSAATTDIVLSQVPTDTPIVVVDATGTAEPLATQAAADIIDTGDPIWCPSGDLPDNVNCTAGYTTVNLLIKNLGSKSGAGTVYFTSTYATNDVTFNQNNAHLTNLTDLTIQGGWNGSTSSPMISGVTTFSVPVTITNWNSDVTLNDIVISGVTSGNGLTVKTTGNITLHNVKANHNSGGVGAKLDNTSGSGTSITISSDSSGNSEFSNNGSQGLAAYSNGDITLMDVTADGNTNNGAYLDNTGSSTNSTVTVDDSTFGDFPATGNGLAGLKVYSNGDIALTDVIADNNTDSGAHLDNTSSTTAGIVMVDNSMGGEFNANELAGLRVFSNGDITLTSVTADNNGDSGVHLDNTGSSTGSSVTVDNSTGGEFNTNGLAGLRVYSNGDITLLDVMADDNMNNGALLDNTSSSTDGTVTVDNSTGGEFNANGTQWSQSQFQR